MHSQIWLLPEHHSLNQEIILSFKWKQTDHYKIYSLQLGLLFLFALQIPAGRCARTSLELNSSCLPRHEAR